MSRTQIIKAVVVSCILAACVYLIVQRFEWQALWVSVRKSDFLFYTISTLLSGFLFLLVRSMRWYVLMEPRQIRGIPFAMLHVSNSVALAIGIITPFQSGELLKVELLKHAHYEIDRKCAYGVVVVEKMLDLFVLIVLALLFQIFRHSEQIGALVEHWWLACCIGSIFAGFLLIRGARYLRKHPHRLPPFISALGASCFRNPYSFLSAILFTAFSWLAVALSWHFCFQSLGLSLSYWSSSELTATVTLLNIASMVPGAVGVSELGISVYLQGLEVPAHLAQAGAFLVRGYSLVMLFLGALHGIFLVYRSFSKRNQSTSGVVSQIRKTS